MRETHATARPMARLIGAICLLVTATSCVSNGQYRSAVASRDAQIEGLREERTTLKSQVNDLENRLRDAGESLRFANDENARLLEAAARIDATPTPAATDPGLAELEGMGMDVSMRGGRAVITIPSAITFGSGKATLSRDGEAALEAVARGLKREYPNARYWIEGHTDNDPISKSKFASNRALSIERANAVLEHLVRSGIANDRCVIAGWGEFNPVGPNDSKANKARNRRVEIQVETLGR